MCDKSRNTWLCVHWQWNTLEWCQLNALQASPVVHLVTPLSCVSFSMNTQPSVPAIKTAGNSPGMWCDGPTMINVIYMWSLYCPCKMHFSKFPRIYRPRFMTLSSDSWKSWATSLQWRHNGRDSISNQRKTSKLCVTGLCAGCSPGIGEFLAQMASNAVNVSIWWRHHVGSKIEKNRPS